MNWEQLSKMSGKDVVLWPTPVSQTPHSNWILLEASKKNGISLKNTATDHQINLGSDNVQEFITPNFLCLKVRLSLNGMRVDKEPYLTVRDEFSHPELSLLDDLKDTAWKRLHIGSFPVYERLFNEGFVEKVGPNAQHLFDPRQDFGVSITAKGRAILEIDEIKKIIARRINNKPQALPINTEGSFNVRLELNAESIRTPDEQGNIYFDFRVNIFNAGARIIDKYQLHLEFPRFLLNESQNHAYAMEDKRRATATHRFFKVSEADHFSKSIDPGDNKLVIGFSCCMAAVALTDQQILKEKAKARFYFDGTLAAESEKEISQLLKLNLIDSFD